MTTQVCVWRLTNVGVVNAGINNEWKPGCKWFKRVLWHFQSQPTGDCPYCGQPIRIEESDDERKTDLPVR